MNETKKDREELTAPLAEDPLFEGKNALDAAAELLRALLGGKGASGKSEERSAFQQQATAKWQQIEQTLRLHLSEPLRRPPSKDASNQFLANLSHEIRTPMNAIVGLTEQLLDTALNAKQREFAETIRQSAEASLTVINDILDCSLIESGRFMIDCIDFDLRAMIDDVTELLSAEARRRGIDFRNQVQADVTTLLRGDPGRLRQILLNLTNNALKFTTKGQVCIEASMASETEKDATVRFGVLDTGVGIAAEKIEGLFDSMPITQEHNNEHPSQRGFGLKIAKQLVSMMGGEMGVSSEPDMGSTFWFQVRLLKQPDAPRLLDVAADIRGHRILIVDDNATSRYVLRQHLKAWGCQFAEAASGALAIEKLRDAAARNEPFDIALVDMQMPKMDGETLGQQIKADPAIRSTQIVILTAVGQRGDAARLRAIGVSGYLTKPFSQSVLFDCLINVASLGQRAPAKQSCETLVTRHSVIEARKRRVRILLVEDNVINQKLAQQVLGRLGYRADVAQNGKEAIEILENQPYDLVIMDVQMPLMDGVSATWVIRNPDSAVLCHDVPIIGLTADGLHITRDELLDAGMNDYVAKPIRAVSLRTAIEQQLVRWYERHPERARPSIASLVSFAPAAEAETNPKPREAMVLNRSELIDKLDGDLNSCREILAIFLSDTQQRFDRLAQALEDANMELAQREIHTLKGASANIEAERLRESTRDMEAAVRKGDAEAAKKLLAEARVELARLRPLLESF